MQTSQYTARERKTMKRAQRQPAYQRERLARLATRRTIEAELSELAKHEPIVPKGASPEGIAEGQWTTAYNTSEIRVPGELTPTRTEAFREHYKNKKWPLLMRLDACNGHNYDGQGQHSPVAS